MPEVRRHFLQPPAGLLMTVGVGGDGIGWSSIAEPERPAAAVRAESPLLHHPHADIKLAGTE